MDMVACRVPLLTVRVPFCSSAEVAAAAVSVSVVFPDPEVGDTENPLPDTDAVYDILLVVRLMVSVPPSCVKVTVVGLASR